MRLFVFMEFHDRMGLVTKTIGRVWTDMYHFLIIFVLSVVMLSFLGWNLLGADSPDFRDFFWTLQMVFQMSIGDNPEYETEIWRRDPIFGTIFYWLVNLLSALFLMNVFLVRSLVVVVRHDVVFTFTYAHHRGGSSLLCVVPRELPAC
jgi:hypothetical protein